MRRILFAQVFAILGLIAVAVAFIAAFGGTPFLRSYGCIISRERLSERQELLGIPSCFVFFNNKRLRVCETSSPIRKIGMHLTILGFLARNSSKIGS